MGKEKDPDPEGPKGKNMLILWIRIPKTAINYAFLLKKL